MEKTDNVTSNFNFKIQGQTITAAATKFTDDALQGKLTFHFHAKVKAGADLSKYLTSDKQKLRFQIKVLQHLGRKDKLQLRKNLLKFMSV